MAVARGFVVLTGHTAVKLAAVLLASLLGCEWENVMLIAINFLKLTHYMMCF